MLKDVFSRAMRDEQNQRMAVMDTEPLMEFAQNRPVSLMNLIVGKTINAFANSFLDVHTDEATGDIIITGNRIWTLMRDIKEEWRTSRIEKNMFKSVSRYSARIDGFFAVELMFIFDRLAVTARANRAKYYKLSRLIYENTWLKAAAEAEPLPINLSRVSKEMNITLLPVQTDYLTRYSVSVPRMNLRGNVLGSAPGSGKTIAGFAWSLAFDMDVCIFIVPKNSLHEVWEETIQSRFLKEQSYWLSDSGKKITGKEQWIVCHYEAMDEVIKALSKFKKSRLGVWVDECHNFNEESSKRTQKLITLCSDESVDGVTWASGTPLKALAREASAMMHALVPNYNEEVAVRYKKSLASAKHAGEIVKHRLGHLVYSVPKNAVVQNEIEYVTWTVTFPGMKDYTLTAVRKAMNEYISERVDYYKVNGPAMIDKYIGILKEYEAGLSTQELPEYKRYVKIVRQLHKHFNQWEDGDIVVEAKRYEKEHIEPTLDPQTLKVFRKIAPVYKYPALVIRGEALGHVLTGKRIECFNKLAEHADLGGLVAAARKKTLIFSSYVETVNTAADVCKEIGLKPVVVHGTAESTLDKAVGTFRQQSKANPLIATFKSLSTAVPLTEASTLLLLNHPYRDYEYQQATARVDRLGQDGPVIIVDVVLDTGDEPNLTTRGKDIMGWSKEATDYLLGDTVIDIKTNRDL